MPPKDSEPEERGDYATIRNHVVAFKAQVAFVAVKGDNPLAELATQFGVHPTQITGWMQHVLARAIDVSAACRPHRMRHISRSSMLRIGQLALENDFFEDAVIKAGLLSAKR